MSFTFQYDRVLRMARSTFANAEVRLFGNIVAGSLSLEDTVLVPVLGGVSIPTVVARFTEDFSEDWCGLPFYHTVRPDSIGEPFCVCVVGTPLLGQMIKSPGQLIAP